MTPRLMIVFALLCVALPVHAETKGERALRLMDEAMTRAKDQFFVQEITTKEPGKEPRVVLWHVHIKGTTFRRVDFEAPGDVKGMKVLIRSLDQMYVYMPAYRKVRRVASHVRSQGFMGMTLSHDDASIVTYSPVYRGKLIEETDTHWKVEAIRRPGQSFPYARMEFDIRKDVHQPDEIRYFNDRDVKVKTEIRSDNKCQKKDGVEVCAPMRLKLIDHTRNDMYSELVTKEWKINTGVEESYFTVRALQRRR